MRLRTLTTSAVLVSSVLLGSVATMGAATDPPPLRTSAEDSARDQVASTKRETKKEKDAKEKKKKKKKKPKRNLEAAYPRQMMLVEPPVNPDDRSIRLGLLPYHELAPRLNQLQQVSNRVSVEIIGQSVQGRDLYLVTVTNPERPNEAREQERFRQRIKDDAVKAANDRRLIERYKAPVFINNNIHGNEWEGTDASMRIIEDLATSTDPEVAALLDRTRLYFMLTLNPDGRVANTRANANGFDMNRDHITGSQPEVRAIRQAFIDTQPLVMLDMHGYVNPTLIEPTTPPHGQNYEYDLFIKHAWANGLAMEAAVQALPYGPSDLLNNPRKTQIPFRDRAEGWDDWPPIFTPQYVAFHGAIAHTIEFPLSVNGNNYNNLSVTELRRRSAINVDIAEATIRAAIAYTDANRTELIRDQIEVFRRGTLGEPQRIPPLEWVPGFGPEDIYTTTFPRAYVIPVGAQQRSAVAAARLVDFLISNDVRVEQAERAFTLNGTTYPAGTYLVDMHQPKRGLANVILEAGGDVTERVTAMYDISGWSHRLLWGASVDVIETADLKPVRTRPVVIAAPTGSVAASGDLLLRLDDAKDLEALNDLLDAGAAIEWLGDGSVRIAAADRARAVALSEQLGVVFRSAPTTTGVPLSRLAVAAAAPADELFVLRQMGFEVVPVNTTILNAGFDWSTVDVLYVSSGLVYNSLNTAARTNLINNFLRTHGGVVARGATGNTFNTQAGLLVATRVAAPTSADGVVAVTNEGGPITAGMPTTIFVNGPSWFTNLGPEVTVEQRYATSGPLISGFWRPNNAGANGQPAARGQAVVVRGVDETGAGVVLFGSEPMYRAHPWGSFALVGRSLHWASTVARVPATVG